MDHTSLITSITQEFITQLGFPDDITIEVKPDPDSQIYNILLSTPNAALVIGYHGETLAAIQLLLSLHLHSRIEEWVNISVNVNDYRERRASSLHALADSVVARVVATSQSHTLPPMPSNERRVIHMYLSNHPQVSTTSTGEGRSRALVISPKA